MEKLTISIDPEQWGDLITKYQSHSPRLKETDFSAGTINLDTDTNGSLTKRKGSVNYNPTLLAAAPKDQYEAIFSDGARHLLVVANGVVKYSSGDTIFNSVVNGTGFNAGANFEFATTQDRVYGCNKINSPQVYDRVTSYGGVTYTAPQMKVMGAQAPSSAPTAGAPTAGGAVPNGAHRYKVTFVYYDSEESNGSAASSVQTAGAGNNTIPLTAIPVGGYGVTQRGIYRDNNDGNYTLLTYITDNTTTVYSDVLLIGVTPTPIPTNNGVPPTFGLISLWLDRLWLSQVPGDPYTLFYSEVSQPDIYGSENQILCNQEDPITATVVYFDRLIVFNRRSMGQIVGSAPDTFRYAAIPSSVGCVDNRTLQTHVLSGVPVLMWLSERGFYTYDGNAIEYISDVIEDLINYNIRQAIQQKNSNSQTSFSSGTPSNGIDVPTLASSITTRGYQDGTSVLGTNPQRLFSTMNDWENGTQISDLALRKGDNRLQAIDSMDYETLLGTRSGDVNPDTSFVALNTLTDFTGADNGTATTGTPSTIITHLASAQPIAPVTRAGTITQISVRIASVAPLNVAGNNFRLTVWDDNVLQPGSILAQGNIQFMTSLGQAVFTLTTSIALAANQKVWIGIQRINPANSPAGVVRTTDSTFAGYASAFFNGSWISLGDDLIRYKVGYTFVSTPIATNGSYVSDGINVFDSGSVSATQAYLTTGFTAANLFGTKAYQVNIEASTDNVGFALIYSSSVRGPLVNQPVALSGQRYLRVRIVMSTTDNRETDLVSSVNLKFTSPVDWISEVIDCTSDATLYDALTMVSQVTQVGSSVALSIATSTTSGGTWTGTGNGDKQFGPFGSHIVRQYVKLKVTFTMANVPAQISPSVTSIDFRWTLVSSYNSVIIDTAAVPPAGWDVFLAQYLTNGGIVQFSMRSAASSGGIAGATFYSVLPNDFPTVVAPLQFVQWQVVITSSHLQVPVIDSVTTQWFIGLAGSVRPASIFVDGRYYVSLAELNQTVNNVLIQFDLNGKWRRHSGSGIATFSYFFNRPYYGLAASGQIRKFLDGTTDAGSPIEFDVRTKAFDYSTSYKDVSDKQKIVGEVIVHLKNTGAAIQFMYSPDEGENFYPLYALNGATTYQTSTVGNDIFLRLKPSWVSGVPIAGQHLMYRIYSNDIYTVQIHTIKMQALVRKQPPVITG